MSIKLILQAWELDIPDNEQKLLAFLADHANDDGANCFPDVARLAHRMRRSERMIQILLGRLKDRGLIVPIAHASGGRSLSTMYLLALDQADRIPPYVPPWDQQCNTEKGETSLTEKGETYISPEPSLTVIEPSFEPSGGRVTAPIPIDSQVNSSTGTVTVEATEPETNSPPPAAPPAKEKPRTTKPKGPATVGQEFVAKMRERYPAMDVEAEIEAALNHKAVLKAINVEKYVQNWLRRAEQWAADDVKKQGKQKRATRAEVNANWETYSFFNSSPDSNGSADPPSPYKLEEERYERVRRTPVEVS